MRERVRMAAVGDIMLGEYAALGFGARTQSLRCGHDWPFAEVRELLSRADLAVGNLEAPLSERGRRPFNYASVVFRGHPGAASALAGAGFRVLTLANNHMLQHGRKAFADTVSTLAGAGIVAAGLRDPSGGSRLSTVEVKGQRLGFLGYSLWPSEVHEEENDAFPMLVGNEQKIIDDVHRHAPDVDHLFVCMHWGYEFVHVPSEREIALGRALIDAGARAVFGHHPHVLQGVEKYNGGLIAYSLGNFVFDMDDPACRECVILELEVGGEAVDYRLHPIVIDATFRPRLAEGAAAEAILAKMRDYSRRISDPAAAGERGVEACRAASAEGKIEAQRSQNRFFMRNLHRYPWRFVLVKIYRKLKNKLLGRYERAQYTRDISHV